MIGLLGCLLSDFYALWFVSYAAVCLSFCLLFSLQVEVYILSVYIDIWAPFPVAGELQLKGVELQTHHCLGHLCHFLNAHACVCVCVCVF